MSSAALGVAAGFDIVYDLKVGIFRQTTTTTRFIYGFGFITNTKPETSVAYTSDMGKLNLSQNLKLLGARM